MTTSSEPIQNLKLVYYKTHKTLKLSVLLACAWNIEVHKKFKTFILVDL